MSKEFLNLVKMLFETKTISPSYKTPHIVYTIMLIGRENQGIGRYRIMNEVGIGEGSIKTLLNKLKEMNIIVVENQKQRGHILTKKGNTIYKFLIDLIKFPHFIDNLNNQYVVGEYASFTLINHLNLNKKLEIGIKQRDEAIKIGGSGATCLIFNGKCLVFPGKENKLEYTIDIDKFKLNSIQKDDMIIIGGGLNKSKSILATLSASLSIVNI